MVLPSSYPCAEPRWWSAAPRWTRWFGACPGRDFWACSPRDSTSPPHWWAGRCSSSPGLPFASASLCTPGTWTGGSSRPRTSGRTSDRRTWSPAPSSGGDKAGSPAAEPCRFRGQRRCFLSVRCEDRTLNNTNTRAMIASTRRLFYRLRPETNARPVLRY